MRRIIVSGRFKKDFKRMMKRGADEARLKAVVNMLLRDEALPTRCRPHRLTGEWSGFWECHVEPDWLLVYDLTPDFVELAATGTHSDLFR